MLLMNTGWSFAALPSVFHSLALLVREPKESLAEAGAAQLTLSLKKLQAALGMDALGTPLPSLECENV